jgi:hypothetical protein
MAVSRRKRDEEGRGREGKEGPPPLVSIRLKDLPDLSVEALGEVGQ